MINVHEAKTHLSRLLDRVKAGEEITLAKAGEPYAKLVPIVPPAGEKRKGGQFEGLIDLPDSFFFDPLPDDELDLWEGK